MGLASVGQIRAVPEMLNESWRRRYDLNIQLRRQISRTYAIENLLIANIELITDQPPTDTIIPISGS